VQISFFASFCKEQKSESLSVAIFAKNERVNHSHLLFLQKSKSCLFSFEQKRAEEQSRAIFSFLNKLLFLLKEQIVLDCSFCKWRRSELQFLFLL